MSDFFLWYPPTPFAIQVCRTIIRHFEFRHFPNAVLNSLLINNVSSIKLGTPILFIKYPWSTSLITETQFTFFFKMKNTSFFFGPSLLLPLINSISAQSRNFQSKYLTRVDWVHSVTFTHFSTVFVTRLLYFYLYLSVSGLLMISLYLLEFHSSSSQVARIFDFLGIKWQFYGSNLENLANYGLKLSNLKQ